MIHDFQLKSIKNILKTQTNNNKKKIRHGWYNFIKKLKP